MEPKKPFHEVVAERLIEQLKQGTAPWQKPWEAGDVGGLMPFNPTSGKRYKGINAIHLLSQGREDQRWMTFKQANAVGAQIRKGERSTPVQYWKFEEEQIKRDEKNKPVLDANGKAVKVRVRLERPKMFMANVFNAEQIDGLPDYQKPVQTWNALERAEQILAASGADIRHGGDVAYYRPSTDHVQLPRKAAFPSADKYYATALHELGHWTGHGLRLDRDLSHPFGSEGYAKEELRAEIASMILGDELGIGHDPEQHASYVQSWIKALQSDPLEIFRAAADAEKIQTYVLGFEQKVIQSMDNNAQQDDYQTWIRDVAIRLVELGVPVDEVEEEVTDLPWFQERFNDGAFPGVTADEYFHQLMNVGRDEPQQLSSPEERVAGMRLLQEPRPTVEAEEWTLRAIDRLDLDQVVRRMTDNQLNVFNQVLAGMHPLSSMNDFWSSRPVAMADMQSDTDAFEDRIDLATKLISDEQHRRVDVAKRDEAQNASEPVMEPDAPETLVSGIPVPEISTGDRAIASAFRSVRSADTDQQKIEAQQHLEALSQAALGFAIPADWTGRIRIAGIVNERGDAVDLNGMLEGDPFQSINVYAMRQDDWSDLLKSVHKDEGNALQTVIDLEDRLSVIYAHSLTDQLWREEAFAAIALSRVQNDLSSGMEEFQAAQALWFQAERRAVANTPEHMTDEALAERFSTEQEVQKSYTEQGLDREAATHLKDVLHPLRDELADRRRSAQPPLSPNEQMVATALRNVRSEPDLELKESFGRLLTSTSGQALGYDLPGNWNGETQVAGIVTDPDGESVSMAQGNQVPEFYGLYARGDDGKAIWLADYETEALAQAQADRLEVISAQAQVEQRQSSFLSFSEKKLDPELIEQIMGLDAQFMDMSRTMQDYMDSGDKDAATLFRNESGLYEVLSMLKSARTEAGLLDFEVLRQPGDIRDTDTEVDAQEFWDETRQHVFGNNPGTAHLLALGQAPQQGERWMVTEDLQRIVYATPRQQEQNKEQSNTQDLDRTYLNVPFKEKDQAKALGAKYDRQERSWYIPNGLDKELFSQWVNPPSVAATPETQTQSPPVKAVPIPKALREYLAVPFGEKDAAKAAGALYDKVAHSWYVGPSGDTAALERWRPENVSSQQSPAMDLREEFISAMEAVGLVPGGAKDHPIMDGLKHRVPVVGGKKGSADGFYVAHTDGHPAGVLINNKTGVKINWKSKGYTLSDEQKAALKAEAATKLQAREDALNKTHEKVSAKIIRSMADLVPVTDPTPYMTAKSITALPGVLTDKAGKETIIPAIDADGKQWTAQYIQKDGTKRFAKDGKKEGCFHVLGGLDALESVPVIVIGEGYATASTLASSLGYATVAAFDSGNLPAVAAALHGKYPDKPIVIAGDDDRHQVMTHGTNTGKTKATEAAKAVGGSAIFPIFAPGESLYPESLPPITPQAYRKHQKADRAIKDLINEGGAAAGDPLQSEKAAQLKAEMLSPAQIEALDNLKRLTDFNDLATKSSLGREGVERQVNNAVAKAVVGNALGIKLPTISQSHAIKETPEIPRRGKAM
nr:zincin-like metallopeptidase domain-containing protein [Pseudomonas syringae]